MSEKVLITLLKCAIVVGLCLLLTGHLLLLSDSFKQSFGIYSYMISAMCIAFGIIFSLPTKMYLTILLMKNEQQNEQQST